MGNWFDLASGAISGAASLVGIPWQQDLQKELMHENEAINIAQWNRENEYNSPKEQMKRLREAGLNPDLAISGNVANTAGNAQVTAGTPQAPGAASAVGQAVRNAQSAAMIDSEISKNESEANRNNAQASVSDADARFKNATFGLGIKRICAEIGLTEQQTMESVARAQYFDMSCAQLSTYISKMNQEIRLYDYIIQGQKQQNRAYTFQADMMMKELSHWDQTYKAHMEETISGIGLNQAHAGWFRAQTTQLFSTLSSYQLYMTNLAIKTGWEGSYWFRQQNYVRQQGQYLQWQIDNLPNIYAEAIYNGSKFLQHNEDGSLVLDKKGHPVAKDGANLDYGLERGQQMVDIFQGFSHGIMNLGVAYGSVKSGIGFHIGGAPQVKGSSAPKSLNDIQSAAYRRWQNAAPGVDKERAYNQFLRTLSHD